MRLVRFSLRYTFFAFICCFSLFIICDSIFSLDCIIQTSYGTGTCPDLPLMPPLISSLRISLSSWNYAGSNQSFVFYHPPVFSAVTGYSPWISVQLGCMPCCTNHRGDSFRRTEIKTAGKREPDSTFQRKNSTSRGIPNRQRISLNIENCLFST